MYDYTQAKMNDDAIRAISSIGLAHLGDAVYELLVRTYLCVHGKATGRGCTARRSSSSARRSRRALPKSSYPF